MLFFVRGGFPPARETLTLLFFVRGGFSLARETLTLLFVMRGGFSCGIVLFSRNLCLGESGSTMSIYHEYARTLPACGALCV